MNSSGGAGGPGRCANPAGRGFSLAELMVALGIMGIGLVMVATAFPSGILENEQSLKETMSTLISRNAAALCRVNYSHAALKGILGGRFQVLSAGLPDQPDRSAWRAYPIARGDIDSYPDDWVDGGADPDYPASRYGYLLAACQAGGSDDNDYRFVIVPYRKFLSSDLPPVFSDTQVVLDGLTVKANAAVGSPVIKKDTGEFAFVIDSDGRLSRDLPVGDALAVNHAGGKSPAIGCFAIRTGIAP